MAADTLPGDSVRVPADSLQEALDSVPVDTVYYNLPALDAHVPGGWVRGVWVWDYDDIMRTGAQTLVELLAAVPGMVPLRAGDYGTPQTLTAFGAGGGGVRILRDGFEVLPLAGGVPDLMRVGLGGIQEVRLERNAGELVIHLTSRNHDDHRPFSLVEAGTGDLDTNVFRGTFLSPRALGGSVGLALERADTRGPGAGETGNRTGTWLRYQLHRGDRSGLAVDFRRTGSETEVTNYASNVTRTDWSVRGRHEIADGLVAELYTGKSTHRVEDEGEVYERDGGSRSQHGARLALSREVMWGRAEYRRFGGEALPSDRLDLNLGLGHEAVGGVSGSWTRSSWPETSTSYSVVRGWTAPLLGFSLFASLESGSHGSRLAPIRDVVPPPDSTDQAGDTATAEADSTGMAPPDRLFAVTERSARRLGARFAWRGVALSGALLRVEADSLIPTGLEPDRGEPLLPGGERTGWEVQGRLPLPILDGLHVQGSLQQWDEEGPYLPERIYRGAFVYNKTFLESGNFELSWALGVRGRDPMSVHRVVEDDGEGGEEEPPAEGEEPVEPALNLARVPFYQSWYGTIEARIVSVRIFIGWENFTVRRNLQDYPDRTLPATRAFYGLRWTMWN